MHAICILNLSFTTESEYDEKEGDKLSNEYKYLCRFKLHPGTFIIHELKGETIPESFRPALLHVSTKEQLHISTDESSSDRSERVNHGSPNNY